MSEVEIRNINKKFGDVSVLSNVTLSIEKGEFITFLGPSGCGKTTLLKIIADLERPTSGEVLIEGKTTSEARKKRKYGMVFQTPALMEWRTVLENIMLPLEIQGVPKKERKKIAKEKLELVDLIGYEDYYPSSLSGGMRQRVGIARALCMDPDILLMDEPFSALDEFTKARLHDDLLRIWQRTGKTIIFVTHNISEAVYLSDRVCVFTIHPARLSDIVTINLHRPRNLVLKEEEYFNTVNRIRDRFEVNYYESI